MFGDQGGTSINFSQGNQNSQFNMRNQKQYQPNLNNQRNRPHEINFALDGGDSRRNEKPNNQFNIINKEQYQRNGPPRN